MSNNLISSSSIGNDIDVDSVVEKIKHLDSSEECVNDFEGQSPAVVEAINRLRTLQLIKDIKTNAEHVNDITNGTGNSVRVNDAFSNPVAKLGWGEENIINATQYPMTRLTQDWQLLTSLYRTSWIVQRVCNAIPEDALSDLSVEIPEATTDEIYQIKEEIRSTHLRESLLEGLRWGRLYGGAAAIIMVSGQEEDLSLPLDRNNILPGSFRGLYIVDRWSGIYPGLQLVDNDRDPDFGLPEYYEVRDESGGGTYRVHHSRVIRFCGTKMPYWEQVAEQYWGTSVIETIYDELIKHDNVAHNIANLTFKANLNVLKVENLDQMFATSSTVHQRRMYSMLSAISTIENSFGIRLLNSTDDLQQLQYSFSGLPEVMDASMMDMAGATGIPVTRLFGRSPAGMNSTGESDERMYRQALEQERAVHITPALEKLISIVCRSAIGRFPKGAKFKYPSLLEIPQQEKASIIDQTLGPMERLFQANLIPGDVVLESVRNAQISMDITSSISDENIEKVKGKYQNDLMNNADPYGGAMQSAEEAGGEQPQVDENGNPVEQQVDENGNPVDANAEAQQQQEEMQIKAAKPAYEEIAKKLSPETSKEALIQAAELQGITPEELRQRLKEERIEKIKQKKREKAFRKVINEFPDDTTQSVVSELGVAEGLSEDDFYLNLLQEQAKRDPKARKKLELIQAQMEQQPEEQQQEEQ